MSPNFQRISMLEFWRSGVAVGDRCQVVSRMLTLRWRRSGCPLGYSRLPNSGWTALVVTWVVRLNHRSKDASWQGLMRVPASSAQRQYRQGKGPRLFVGYVREGCFTVDIRFQASASTAMALSGALVESRTARIPGVSRTCEIRTGTHHGAAHAGMLLPPGRSSRVFPGDGVAFGGGWDTTRGSARRAGPASAREDCGDSPGPGSRW
jgi:hypothetical protein